MPLHTLLPNRPTPNTLRRNRTGSTAPDGPDDVPGLSELLRSPGYPAWRTQVQATGGCAAPIHLTGSSRVLDHAGSVLTERGGRVLAPCGNRRASVCPACADRYSADTFHLLRAGMCGGTKGVPNDAAGHPRAFVTLTAPSFGPVHTRRLSARGHVIPCACTEHHHEHDPRVGGPLDPDGYDYIGAVLWQAHAGALWARFTTRLRRELGHRLGVRAREVSALVRPSYAKVAEYQRRGLVHFHAVIRLDGPDGPTTAPPATLTADDLHTAIRAAAGHVSITTRRPDGTTLALRWGRQTDVRPITATARDQLETPDGDLTDAALAAYVAKYATKGTGKSEATDRPIRDIAYVEHMPISEHHRRMIRTAWQLGGTPGYERLNLRRWAHMLGFRGHFLTKSHAYSTTFGQLRAERRRYRLTETLRALDHPTGPDTVTVINDWRVLHIGHHNDAERELAHGIYQRQRHGRAACDVQRGAA